MLANILPQHRPETLDEAQAIIEELQHELYQAYTDPIWGVLSRQGIERRMQHTDHTVVAIVADIDHMHDANAKYSHEGTDLRVAAGLRAVDIPCGRWKRGDELVFLVERDDARGAAERARANLKQQGISVTIAIVWEATPEAVTVGLNAIGAEKNMGRRGHIIRVEGGRA